MDLLPDMPAIHREYFKPLKMSKTDNFVIEAENNSWLIIQNYDLYNNKNNIYYK